MQAFHLKAVTILFLFLISEQWIGVESFVFRHITTTENSRCCPQFTLTTTTTSSPTSRATPTRLWLAGQRRSTGNKKNKPKSKKKKSNNPGKGKKGKNGHESKSKKGGASKNPMATTSTGPKKSNQKSKKVAPPWQTISKKDMDQNVRAEKARRKIARETGEHLTPLQLEETQLSYQRSKSFLSPQDKALLAWKPFALNSNKQEVLFQGAFLNKKMPPRLGTPEVAFLGRSNVGKSSLLNRLVGKSDLARVGKTPGATASVNLYGIFDTSKKKVAIDSNNQKALMGLVDLPGFGYAKLSKETKKSVQDTAENYLAKRKELALGILLVDSRRTPTTDDKAVLAALYDMGLPLMVVATKVDKFSTQAKVDEALGVINRELGLPKGQPLCISCVTGTGIKDLWKIIMEACEGHVGELKNNVEKGTGQQQLQQEAGEEDEYYDDEEDGEIAYSQGYDWVQDSVMYEAEEGDYAAFDGEEVDANAFDDDYDDDYDDYDDYDGDYDYEDGPASTIPQKETLKFLKQKARDMERRGEFGEF